MQSESLGVVRGRYAVKSFRTAHFEVVDVHILILVDTMHVVAKSAPSPFPAMSVAERVTLTP